MKTREALGEAKGLFSREPSILRVEADLRGEGPGVSSMDFTIFVHGELYEAESRVIPLVMEFMRRFPAVPIEFVVLPSSVALERNGILVLDRKDPSKPT